MSIIGYILTGANTLEAKAQIIEEYERQVREGMFVLIESKIGDKKSRILGRIARIETYNEFYEIGDVWSEARRKGREIPTDIARKYTIATIELLGLLPNLKEITIPPSPSDHIIFIENTSEIFRTDPSKVYIEFGSIYGYENIPVPLSVEGIPMHMAFIGVTGSGKSYTFGYFIERIAKIKEKYKKTIPMVIIDANADYIDYYEAYNGNKFSGFNGIRRVVFPESTAHRKSDYSELIKIELKLGEKGFTPADLAEIIVDFYKSTSSGELQVSVLQSLFEFLEAQGTINLNITFSNQDLFENDVIRILESMKRQFHSASVEAAKRAIKIFRDALVRYNMLCLDTHECINWGFLENIVENQELVIFDFSADGATGVPVKLKQFVVAYLSMILYKLFVDYKINGKTKYLIFAIEEAQNYCPNLSKYPVGADVARKYIALIATQGRKFGLSLALITQRPAYVDPIAMAMVNTFFVHRTAPDDMAYLRKLLGGISMDLFNKVPNLETGHLIVHGQMVPFGFPILLRIPPRKIEPTIGKTNVSNYIRGD